MKIAGAGCPAAVNATRYAGSWVSDAFQKHGVRYVASERSRSELYLDALPELMSGSVSILDDPRLIGQISQLERRTTRMGRDAVNHMQGAADDLANAALGALVHVPTARRSEPASFKHLPTRANLAHAKASRYQPPRRGFLR